MDKKRKNNFLEARDRIPYEELLSENGLICDIYFKDGKCYQVNGYEVNIATDKIFILRKMGKIVEKTIFPIFNILAIKEYYIDYTKQSPEKEETEEVEQVDVDMEEMKKEGYAYLPGHKGRELAKKQFQKAIKLKDRDIIKQGELEVKEEEVEEEKKIIVSGKALLEGKIGNE